MAIKFEDYLKKLAGLEEEDPEQEVADMDFADEIIKVLYVDQSFNIPDKDKEKFLTISDKIVFYPPEEYCGKKLTTSAFIDMMKKYKIVPVTMGNYHVFITWKQAKEEFGYAILFKHLFETYRIVPAIGDDGYEVISETDRSETKRG